MKAVKGDYIFGSQFTIVDFPFSKALCMTPVQAHLLADFSHQIQRRIKFVRRRLNPATERRFKTSHYES